MSSPPTYRLFDSSEPRRPNECVGFRYRGSSASTLPSELTALAGMLFAAIAMITRYYGWAWLALICSISSIFSTRKLAPKKENSMWSGWSVFLFSITALFSVYTPLLTGVAMKAEKPFGLSSGTVALPRQ